LSAPIKTTAGWVITFLPLEAAFNPVMIDVGACC
jgi:hypothetical protein